MRISNGITASSYASPTLSMVVTSYTIRGTRQEGGTFQLQITNGTTDIQDLLPGNWTISVEALNAEAVIIGSGTTQVEVRAGETASANLAVRPLEGTGSLTATVNWRSGVLANPTVTAELIPASGSTLPLNVSLNGNAATCAHPQITTGYHTLLVHLMNNNRPVAGAAEVVRVLKDQNTPVTYTFNNIDQSYSYITVNVALDMADPLQVSLSGQQASITQRQPMTVTATATGTTSNVVYVWYLNGTSVATGPTYTVQNLLPRWYRLDVTAFTADGRRAGSATHEFQVTASTLPAPAYAIPCTEGSGTTVAETVHGGSLAAVGSTLNWCRGDIKGTPRRSFIKSGANFNSAGVMRGDVISANLPQYTLSFLTRITESGSGAILRFANGLHFRFWNGTWDCAGNVVANTSLVKPNTWTRVTFVQNATEQRVYLDDALAGQLAATTSLASGSVRLGAFEDSSYFYPGEFADIRIFDTPFTAAQVQELSQTDGPTGAFAILGDGSDFGGFWKREEHGGQYNSILTTENGLYRHWFNNDTCWGALSVLVPSGNPSLWFSGDFIYPANLDANHDFGDSIQTVGIYDTLDRSNPVAILYLRHEILTTGAERSRITLWRATYRNTAGGATTVNLDGREITKGQPHRFEIQYTQGTQGSVAFYLDGTELHRAAGNFDLAVRQAMFGINLGIHPQNDGNVLYSDNLYVGAQRLPRQ